MDIWINGSTDNVQTDKFILAPGAQMVLVTRLR